MLPSSTGPGLDIKLYRRARRSVRIWVRVCVRVCVCALVPELTSSVAPAGHFVAVGPVASEMCARARPHVRM